MPQLLKVRLEYLNLIFKNLVIFTYSVCVCGHVVLSACHDTRLKDKGSLVGIQSLFHHVYPEDRTAHALGGKYLSR